MLFESVNLVMYLELGISVTAKADEMKEYKR